jgi:hypothetical protein
MGYKLETAPFYLLLDDDEDKVTDFPTLNKSNNSLLQIGRKFESPQILDYIQVWWNRIDEYTVVQVLGEVTFATKNVTENQVLHHCIRLWSREEVLLDLWGLPWSKIKKPTNNADTESL